MNQLLIYMYIYKCICLFVFQAHYFPQVGKSSVSPVTNDVTPAEQRTVQPINRLMWVFNLCLLSVCTKSQNVNIWICLIICIWISLEKSETEQKPLCSVIQLVRCVEDLTFDLCPQWWPRRFGLQVLWKKRRQHPHLRPVVHSAP